MKDKEFGWGVFMALGLIIEQTEGAAEMLRAGTFYLGRAKE